MAMTTSMDRWRRWRRWRRWCFVSDCLLDHGELAFSFEGIIRFPEAFLPSDWNKHETIEAWENCEDNYP